MDQGLLGLARNECLRIGNEVVSQYQQDANGCYWNTITIDRDSNRLKAAQPALYSGVAGISLFLLELYRVSSAPSYLAYAEGAIGWAVRKFQTQPWEQFSLFSGKGGAIFALLRFEAITGKSSYLDAAVSIASTNQNFLSSCGDDIIGGAAGGALALLLLYERTKSERFLHDAQAYANLLMSRMYVGSKGVYWERSKENIGGLCGLAHGCSGIALPFLELFAITREPTYLWIAEQAFRYEDEQMQRLQLRSWPDLRKGRFRPEDFEKHEQAFLRGEKEYFTKPNEFDMWCHGAAGIGFARLRAFEVTGKVEHLESSRRAVSIIAAQESQPNNLWRTYTLCHGRFGNAALLRSWDRVHSTSTYDTLVSSIVRDALDSFTQLKGYLSGYGGMGGPNDMTEASLMMGLSGVGLFFASLVTDISALDFLAPFLHNISCDETPTLPLNPENLLLAKYFPRTLAVIEESELPTRESSRNAEDYIPDFIGRVRSTLVNAEVEMKLELEVQRFRFDTEISSFVFTEVSWEYADKRSQKLLGIQRGTNSGLNPNVKILALNNSAGPHAILLIRRAIATEELFLTPFAYLVLKSFLNGPISAEAAVEAAQLELGDTFDQGLVEQMVLSQISEAIKCGFIVDAQDIPLLQQP